MSGYMRPSILWHLLGTGGASVATLARLLGRPVANVRRVVRPMLAAGQLSNSQRSPGLLELTVRGIDAARAVDVSQVERAPNAQTHTNNQEPKP